MDVTSVDPLRVGSLVWQPEPGIFSFTVVCKATYRLLPGESALAAEPEPLRREDEPWGADASASPYAPGDLAPRKARADVMLVGHAFAPRGEPVRSLVARLLVGPVDKEIEVCGERRWTREGQLREEGRFTSLPLRYELAAGGPGTTNPLGVRTGPGAAADLQGSVLLPNLQPTGGAPESRHDLMEPTGFGPIPASFPARHGRLGRLADGWDETRALESPLPEDFDYAYFNAAPPDQQVPLLRDGERIILQNLHRDHPRLVTSLPASRPRAFAERAGSPPRELGLRCDALWIDTDRALCTLTWRGSLTLATRDEGGRVVVALEPPGKRLRYEDVLELVGPAEPPTLPPAALAAAAAPSTASGDLSEPGPPAKAPEPSPRRRVETLWVSGASGAAPTGPSWLQKSPAPPAAPPPPPSPAPAPVPAAPRFGAPTTTRSITAVLEAPEAMGELLKPAVSWASPSPPAALSWAAEVPAAAPSPWAAEAPSAPSPWAGEAPASAREAVDLLWVDAAAAPRLSAAFPDVLAAFPDLEAAVARVLRVGRRADASAIEDAMAAAVDPDARFRPPLLLVAGELRFLFDEVESLRATVGLALPFAPGDKALRDALDAAGEALALPGGAPGATAERLLQRVLEALMHGGHPLPPGYLAAQVERTLLERRAYQRRAVLGGDRLRALLMLPGAEGPCPVYLPSMLAKSLPLFPSLDAHLVVEAHASQDPAEAAPLSLGALALGRVVSVGRRRGR